MTTYSNLPKEADREILHFLDAESWETSLLSAPKFAYAVRESDKDTRPLRHASKIILNGYSDATHNPQVTESAIVLPGNPPVTRTFTWQQMTYAIRAVTADEGIWQPRPWVNYTDFPAMVNALKLMKPYWKNIEHFVLRTRYPRGGPLLQDFARCFDNARNVSVKPVEEIQLWHRQLWPAFFQPWMHNGGQFSAPWFPDEEQTLTFLQLLPNMTTLDTARMTAGLREPLTQWLHNGTPNNLRVYHADQEALTFMQALGAVFHRATEPATYTIRLAHPDRNWQYTVRPLQQLAPIGRNETTKEILRMGFHGRYYQIDRMTIVRMAP
ncbi:hypothetical protein AAVH_23959 [Aphelenchoides avenae]|nr:hypothetical protein AAVH_23959 [Aphelenchus avenae]